MTPTASYRVANRRTWIIPALAAIVLLVAAAGVYGIASRNDAAVALPSEQQSIAVLPFKNLSGDPANDYFGDGLTEELQGVLSQIGGLRVVARGSSFQFKGKDADPRDVGAKLGVANILDGGVQKSGDRIRITAQLIDTKTGYQIWNETYNRTLSDALAVQDEITSAIGQALRIQFDPASQHFKSRKAVNPAAYDMYLKGLSATRRPSTDALNEGLGYYKQAVQLDSGFTPAWTSMAITYINLANFRALPASKVLPQAEEAMNRALKQDPENPYVQGAYAVLLEFEEKYDQAELQYRKVIEKNPNNSAAHANYSGLLTRRGKLEEAIREAEMAQRLDPLSLSKFSMLGIALMSAGRSKDALAVFDKAETMSPNAINIKVNKSLVLADMGQGPEALKECDRAASLAPDDPQVRLNCAYVKAKAGQRGDALKVVQEFESLPDADNFAVDIAGIYSALGDKDKAFDWLDRIRSIQGFYPATEPTLAGLHNDPRFAAWLNRWKGK